MALFGGTPNPYDPTTTPNATPNDYYSQIQYNSQPYSYSNTPFGAPGFQGAGGQNAYPPMNQTAPGTTAPPPTTTQTAPGGLFNPPDWIGDPQQAAIRAMRQQGMNPGSFNPVTQQILRNAQNLSNTLFGQAAGMADPSQRPDLSNQELMLGKMGDLIKGAAAGGRIFGGFSPQTLANFSQAVAASNAGSTDVNTNFIASYLYNQGDPNRALNLAQSLLYGGLAPAYQSAAAAPLVNLGDYYRRQLEQGTDYGRTVIDILLGAPVAGVPAGGATTPLPFQSSAWRYNP